MSALAEVGAVEVDVRLTRDGHLILSHDPEIGGRTVSTAPAGDLLGLQPRPCLLDEILAFPGRLNLETKNIPGEEGFDSDGYVALLTASRGRATDLLTSFSWPDMDRVKARAGHLLTGLVVGEGGSIEDALLYAEEKGHRAVSAHHSLVDRDICARASRREVGVAVWTVDTVDRARELSGMGVAAIISDDPLLIHNGLRE